MKILVAISICVILHIGKSVKINRLRVPEIIKHGTQAILDCDFTLDDSESDLVVKWYLDNALVYQWIPSTKNPPQSLGPLKNRVNLEYQASVDANSIHRALDIPITVPDLSGNYTCSVSALESEDTKTKSMLVLAPEKYFELKRIDADEGFIRVQCLANEISPKPEMSLHSQQRTLPEAKIRYNEKNRLYDISAQITLPELPVPEVFTCKLSIPKTNYATRRETVFYPGNSPKMPVNKWLSIMSAPLVILFWGMSNIVMC